MKKVPLIIFIAVIPLLINSCSKQITEGQSIDGWGITGNSIQSYVLGKEDDNYNNRPVYYLRSKINVESGFGASYKNKLPEDYRGKRVMLTSFIKTKNVDSSAGMWMRVDGGIVNNANSEALSFDNMMNRPIKGTTDWKKYEIILDVPKESNGIIYGILLSGNGQAWFTEPSFETVSEDVPSTNMLTGEYLKANDGFSELPAELQNIPNGIEVGHNPQTVMAEYNKNDSMYYWVYKTTVKPMTEDLEITEFGSYLWISGHWEFSTVTLKPFDKNDFARWYNCADGKIKKGTEYSDTGNWTRWQTLQKGRTLWYYIGKNSKGEKFKGTAIIDYLPELKK